MLVEILATQGADVQPNSEEISDQYEALIADLHKFLDRLVEESGPGSYRGIFINGGQDE